MTARVITAQKRIAQEYDNETNHMVLNINTHHDMPVAPSLTISRPFVVLTAPSPKSGIPACDVIAE